ncbi:SMR family transporter [Nocardioides sp.]|jgi:small multidrug resistance pump|uniref:DMT family transporter n=1 Tax=Nocardioides sp. TaxID=35761 RepID=UPI00262E8434|nr:SMR family transporter [Nocardioides sp.]
MYAGLLLAGAIAVEVMASLALPKAKGFTDPLWSLLVVAGYAGAIYLLTVVVKDIPVSVAYAIWAGAGTAATAVLAAIFLDETLDWIKVVSIMLIIGGVVGLNLSGTHA